MITAKVYIIVATVATTVIIMSLKYQEAYVEIHNNKYNKNF